MIFFTDGIVHNSFGGGDNGCFRNTDACWRSGITELIPCFFFLYGSTTPL
jgi:hypothetical protein